MNKIMELRTSAGMTRASLSERSGVPVRTIENWENGTRIPRDVYQIKKVADALEKTIDELIF